MLNIRTLQILVEVARQGGFSRAALAGRNQNDLQSTASEMIKLY